MARFFFCLLSLFDASINGFPLEENGKSKRRLKKKISGKKKEVIHHNQNYWLVVGIQLFEGKTVRILRTFYHKYCFLRSKSQRKYNLT